MASANYDINELKRRMQGALGVLKQELGALRTGRASAHLLDPIQVDAYGQSMPLNQLATVSVPQPRMISVQVWDRSMVHDAAHHHAFEDGLAADGGVALFRAAHSHRDRQPGARAQGDVHLFTGPAAASLRWKRSTRPPVSTASACRCRTDGSWSRSPRGCRPSWNES